MLGEIALYSFIMLLLTGTFLALFFDPSMAETTYNGSYTPLRGIEMTKAYETSLNLSFDVRGGLIMRQMHHWAALLFMAAIVVHMFRIFFTGAFRKPRELNWIIGLSLFWLGLHRGLRRLLAAGRRALRHRPADRVTRSSCRSRSSGPGSPRRCSAASSPAPRSCRGSTSCTCSCCPRIILALIVVHMACVVKQKHTQWPGPGSDQPQRGRRADVPELRREGRRVLHGRVRRHRAAWAACCRSTRSGCSGRTRRRSSRPRASPTGTSCSSTARPGSCRPGTSTSPSATATRSRPCSGRRWCCPAS